MATRTWVRTAITWIVVGVIIGGVQVVFTVPPSTAVITGTLSAILGFLVNLWLTHRQARHSGGK